MNLFTYALVLLLTVVLFYFLKTIIPFPKQVKRLLAAGNMELSDEIKTLAFGPSDKATRFSGFIINVARYHTRSPEWKRKIQNNGVMVNAKTCSYASAKDMKSRRLCDTDY